MKTKQIESFARNYLLPHLPGFSVTRWLLHEEPVISVLRAFAFEDSEFDKDAVYVWVFVLPMYVPRSDISFTFGRRLQNRKGLLKRTETWQIGAPVDAKEVDSMLASIKDALPFLSKLQSPALIAKNLVWETKLFGNPFVEEAVAYSLARTGKYSEARGKLAKLISSVKPDDPWSHIAENASELVTAIDRGEQYVSQLLDRWSDQTTRNFRLHTPTNA